MIGCLQRDPTNTLCWLETCNCHRSLEDEDKNKTVKNETRGARTQFLLNNCLTATGLPQKEKGETKKGNLRKIILLWNLLIHVMKPITQYE